MNAVENYRLTAALRYATWGWLVFPLHHPMTSPRWQRCSCGKSDCGQIAKHPRTPNGLHDGTDDPDMIRSWWQRWPAANVGIAMGAVSGVYAVDVDSDKGGDETWASIIDKYGEVGTTPAVDTGGGGLHLFFKHPGGTWPNTAAKLGKGVDTRGDGGYVVAAPSLHASGMHYSWRTDPEEANFALMPDWLKKLLFEPPAKPRAGTSICDGDGIHWLGKALAKVQYGNRNHTGHWLACQLRDAGLTEASSEGIMRDYADRVPRGEKSYTDREAMASLRSAFAKPARETARGPVRQLPSPNVQRTDAPTGAAAELRTFLTDVVEKRIVSVDFPWQLLTELTQALIPGTTTVLVGDPGVGKTYFVLQCLLAWENTGVDAAAYFIEKNRRFHMMRLLAQLEGDAKLLDFNWIGTHGDEVAKAMSTHGDRIDAIGKHIYAAEGKRVTLDDILAWIRQMASAGKRIIIVDPITAVAAGVERWTKDDEFVLAAEHTAAAHGASLVLITHAKKGNRPGSPTGHDTAGGAAYYRFCDTLIWMNKPKKPRKVQIHTSYGPAVTTAPLFFQLHKARNGKGTGHEIAYRFGDGLKFSEQGLVTADLKGDDVIAGAAA